MITVEFSEAEIQSIAKLFDAAVRAGGLEAASHALPILSKIQNAMNANQPEPADASDV